MGLLFTLDQNTIITLYIALVGLSAFMGVMIVRGYKMKRARRVKA